MKKHNCETCKFRKKYDRTPGSIIGRLWRWHINWCPGWRKHMNSLPEVKKEELIQEYDLNS